MTWAKLDDRFNDHPVLLGLPRTTRLLYVEGLVWSCKQETDGMIPQGAVPRFSDADDIAGSVAQLVEAGLWEQVDQGWQIVDFLVDQRAKADIDQARAKNAARVDRYRRHREGDHSRCDSRYCKQACNAVTNGVSNGVGNDPPTRPDPSRTQTGKGRAGSRAVGPRGPLPSPPNEDIPSSRVLVVSHDYNDTRMG